MHTLQETYDELLEAARDGVAAAAYGPDADLAGPLYEGLVDAFQGLAISNVLLNYDAEQFRLDLVYAAGAQRQFRQVCLRDQAAPLQTAISRTDALFCAVAARDEVLTQDLVQLGATAWVPDGEYEDDFCYHAVLSRIVAPSAAGDLPEVEALTERFREVVGAEASARLDLCEALAEGDGRAFRIAFDALLAEREAWVEEMASVRFMDPFFQTTRHLFVEGVALLAVAEARGWPMDDHYAYCPEVARLAPTVPTPPDLFTDVVPLLRDSRRRRGLDT